MYARNPVDEAEQAAVDAPPVTGLNVMSLSRVGVAKRPRLGRREVTPLFGGEFEQSPPEVTTIASHEPILQ